MQQKRIIYRKQCIKCIFCIAEYGNYGLAIVLPIYINFEERRKGK